MRDNKKAEGPRINSIKYSFHRIVTTLNTYERVLTNRRIHLHVLWVLNGIIGLGWNLLLFGEDGILQRRFISQCFRNAPSGF